jgi:hypothetical protein
MVYLIDTAKESFDIILQVGAGTGLLYLLRWFWWRINAWCEVAAMISSFGVSLALLLLRKQAGVELPSHVALLITIGITTLCWLATAYLAPETDRAVLIAFYRKVRPFGPGWRTIREAAGIPAAEAAAARENIPLALLGWSTGCAVVWSALFALGNFLYGRTDTAMALLAVFIVCGIILVRVINRLWTPNDEATNSVDPRT